MGFLNKLNEELNEGKSVAQKVADSIIMQIKDNIKFEGPIDADELESYIEDLAHDFMKELQGNKYDDDACEQAAKIAYNATKNL